MWYFKLVDNIWHWSSIQNKQDKSKDVTLWDTICHIRYIRVFAVYTYSPSLVFQLWLKPGQCKIMDANRRVKSFQKKWMIDSHNGKGCSQVQKTKNRDTVLIKTKKNLIYSLKQGLRFNVTSGNNHSLWKTNYNSLMSLCVSFLDDWHVSSCTHTYTQFPVASLSLKNKGWGTSITRKMNGTQGCVKEDYQRPCAKSSRSQVRHNHVDIIKGILNHHPTIVFFPTRMNECDNKREEKEKKNHTMNTRLSLVWSISSIIPFTLNWFEWTQTAEV